MGLWSKVREMLTSNPEESRSTVHDYTFSFSGHKISMLKTLDSSGRAFIVGEGSRLKSGDIVVVQSTSGALLNKRLRYRLETVQCEHRSGTWRAYAYQEHQPLPSKSYRPARHL